MKKFTNKTENEKKRYASARNQKSSMRHPMIALRWDSPQIKQTDFPFPNIVMYNTAMIYDLGLA